MNLELDIVIMAAGKGTRMKSKLPKVLHKLAGRALLGHVLATAASLQPRRVILITGHGAAEVIAFAAQSHDANSSFPLKTVTQEPQLGTGHAVQQAVPELGVELANGGITLILSGDVPLTQADTLQALIAQCAGEQIALLTIEPKDPTGYGRIVRDTHATGDSVKAIVEQKDASDAQKQIREIYSGIMAAPTAQLKKYLALLDDKNAQKEFYLTDIVKHAVADGARVTALKISDEAQVAGINSPAQLQELEREYQKRAAYRFMTQGVRLADAARFDLRGDLVCGQDVSIDVGCVFEGSVTLGDDVRIGAHCVIARCTIAAGADISPFTHIDGGKVGASIGAGAKIGPFARLRPGAVLAEDVRIGNFVEIKNSTLAKGAKANHLAYLGDATVGERVNFGAGSITANYDGTNKHRTVIEADVNVGSNCVLIAPVKLGAGGTIGGGSTITKDTPAGALTVARGKQTFVENWQRPAKKK
jgi:bifunctional UDP-N-acetylglucosamine pyrophosphorylase / glucosamine-1-phosphate N-acetyltransferase